MEKIRGPRQHSLAHDGTNSGAASERPGTNQDIKSRDFVTSVTDLRRGRPAQRASVKKPSGRVHRCERWPSWPSRLRTTRERQLDVDWAPGAHAAGELGDPAGVADVIAPALFERGRRRGRCPSGRRRRRSARRGPRPRRGSRPGSRSRASPGRRARRGRRRASALDVDRGDPVRRRCRGGRSSVAVAGTARSWSTTTPEPRRCLTSRRSIRSSASRSTVSACAVTVSPARERSS